MLGQQGNWDKGSHKMEETKLERIVGAAIVVAFVGAIAVVVMVVFAGVNVVEFSGAIVVVIVVALQQCGSVSDHYNSI